MTIGQRIARKRKERGLSQEALGERLGVSRQSIYKWESDSALPEIEKLIALSRLFGVSVGWLLGVEEEATPGELSETQLKMVEEIAARYAPKPRLSPRRMMVVKVSSAVAVVCLCGALYGFYQRLEELSVNYNNLQAVISQVQTGVDGQIQGLSGRVEQILKYQNDITADYGSGLLDVDPSRSRAAFYVYAVPKTYVEGMTAEFCVNSKNSVKASEKDGNWFEADFECGLMEEMILSVAFVYPDGSRHTQMLDEYRGLYGQTFPEMTVKYPLNTGRIENGALVLPGEKALHRRSGDAVYGSLGGPGSTAAAQNSAVPVAEVETIRVGLFKNKKLVDWAVFCADGAAIKEETAVLTGEQWEALEDERQKFDNGTKISSTYTFYFPAQEVPLEAGDILQVAAVIQDVYGRTAVRANTACGLDEAWDELIPLGFDIPYCYPDGWMLQDGSSIMAKIGK